jgi:hypothetical protein
MRFAGDRDCRWLHDNLHRRPISNDRHNTHHDVTGDLGAVASNGTAIFQDSLFVGTWNWTDGGEVWMFLREKVYLPLLLEDY